jgi:dTDP-4-dehydrorhamnose reductase
MVARFEANMKWLILGGGQLAKSLEANLTTDNAHFISLTHDQLDITNAGHVQEIFLAERPNVVVNAAAWTNVDLAETNEAEARNVNAKGPEILAGAAAKIESLFVQISTDYVFSGLSKTPWKESALTAPISAYGRTKAEGEARVRREYEQGSLIVRTAWLYSHFGKNFVKTMAEIAIKESRDVEVVSDQIGQPTSAYDLAAQLRLLIDADSKSGIYHATNTGSASWYELAQLVFELCDANSERVKPIGTPKNANLAVRPTYSVLDNENWRYEGLLPMRDWRTALESALPLIISELNG